MTTASSSSVPIVLGPTFQRSQKQTATKGSLVSIKYNFRPPSISNESAGVLHCPKHVESEWQLEYRGEQNDDREPTAKANAQGFSGSQTAAKDVDCILRWDESRQAYVLDRLATTFSLKYERTFGKLSADARDVLDQVNDPDFAHPPSHHEARPSSSRHDPVDEDVEMSPVDARMEEVEAGHTKRGQSSVKEKSVEHDAEEGEDEDDFAKQLERDLEAFGGSEGSQDEEMEQDTRDPPSVEPTADVERQRHGEKAGLGLMLSGTGVHDEVITPRGSPYIDRPTKVLGTAAATSSLSQMQFNPATLHTTPPGMSPASVANSPRPTGLESSLNSSWRPPAQRSNVALAYGGEDDEDEEDDDEDEESDEEDDEDDDEDDEEAKKTSADNNDDDDLDAFARELEGNLMGTNTPVEEKPAGRTATRARRSSGRGKT